MAADSKRKDRLTSTGYPGVRCRQHPTRKHNKRPDQYFTIRYTLNGVVKEEPAGWASDGMSAKKAHELRGKICENIRTGKGSRSLAEMRREGEEAAQRAVEEQRRKEKEAISVGKFWDTIYLATLETDKKPWTIRTEKHLFRNWIRPTLGKIPLQELSPGDVESVVVKAKRAGKKASTIRNILAVISQVWNKAVLHNIVQGDSPTRRVKKPRQDNQRMRFLSPSEALCLLKALRVHSEDTHDIALISLFCGLRAGEVFGLTWGDVDMLAGTLYIRDPKNKKSRHAHIVQEVREVLQRRHSGQPLRAAKNRTCIPCRNRRAASVGLEDLPRYGERTRPQRHRRICEECQR